MGEKFSKVWWAGPNTRASLKLVCSSRQKRSESGRPFAVPAGLPGQVCSLHSEPTCPGKIYSPPRSKTRDRGKNHKATRETQNS